MTRMISRLIVVAGVITLMIAGLFAVDAVPLLRGGFGWQWPYVPSDLVRLLPLIAAATTYVIGTALLWRVRLRWLLVWAGLGVIALTFAGVAVRADRPLEALILRTLSPLTTGSHAAAAEIDWTTTAWYDWPAEMIAFEGRIAHVNLAPPALPLVYAALAGALDAVPAAAHGLAAPILAAQCQNYALLAYTPGEWASAWLGVLMPVWAALGVFPIAAVAGRVGGLDARRAALLLYPLIPALLLFSPTWNTLYPLLSISAFALLDVGLNASGGRRVLGLLAAGLLTGVCVFVNFAFVPLGLLFGVYTLLRWLWQERPLGSPFSRPVTAGTIFGVGVASIWVIYGAMTGTWPWELLSTSLGMHFELDRAYLPWVALHTWDWLLWTGLPIIAIWVISLLRRPTGAPPTLAAALLITMLTLVLSNFARGETGRVWTLFAPFALVAGAALVAGSGSRRAALLIAAAQAVWVIVLAGTIDAVAVDLTSPSALPAAHAGLAPITADFGGQFALTGWSAQAEADGIALRLNWRSTAGMFTPYWLSALLVGPDGAVIGEAVVWQPDDTRAPTTCWPPGAEVGDLVVIPLPNDAAPGSYWISLAAFDDAAGVNRLPVTAAGSTSDQVGLGPVFVQGGT